MRLLLDTHLLSWASAASELLPRAAREMIADPQHDLIFSTASLWEIAIKFAQGRRDFQIDPRLLRRGLTDNGYRELPIVGEHVAELLSLPLIHKDPFDRILVAQAIVEGMTLLTVDPLVGRYPAPIRMV